MDKIKVRSDSWFWKIYMWYTDVECVEVKTNLCPVARAVFLWAPLSWLCEPGFLKKWRSVSPITILELIAVLIGMPLWFFSSSTAGDKVIIGVLFLYLIVSIPLVSWSYNNLAEENYLSLFMKVFFLFIILPAFSGVLVLFIVVFLAAGKIAGRINSKISQMREQRREQKYSEEVEEKEEGVGTLGVIFAWFESIHHHVCPELEIIE